MLSLNVLQGALKKFLHSLQVVISPQLGLSLIFCLEWMDGHHWPSVLISSIMMRAGVCGGEVTGQGKGDLHC